MATTIGSKAVGSIVKLNVGGVSKNFIVVQQGLPSAVYDASCDGTWLLMQDCYENLQWHSSAKNDYAASTIHSYLNSTFLNLFDANIRAAIKQVKIPYRAGSGYKTTISSGANGLSTRIFLLSGKEAAFVHSYVPANEGEVLAYFQGCAAASEDSKRVANLNGSAVRWWLRSPFCCSDLNATDAMLVNFTGNRSNNICSGSLGIRPALILPSSLFVSDDGSISTNTAPTTPASITVPNIIHGGTSITVSWTASTDAQGNLEGYVVQRSTNGGGSWTQIYQGSAKSTTNSVAFGTESVMYRVMAYDSEGLYSGYRTSAQVDVINNTAPTAPGYLTVPKEVQGGQPLSVTWGVSSDGENNLAGYSLERRVDGGGWSVVYNGAGLTFVDTITKGWQTVAYRVRAYDTNNAYSGYTTSEARAVNNNTPPAIACDNASGSDLGTKSEGFSVSYSVGDEEGDVVTVTEAVDGAALRTFTATLGGANSFQVAGLDFMRLLNGTHVLTVSANDGQVSTIHKLTFSKSVTEASVTLAEPMDADDKITICVLSVAGSIPEDAAYTVKVTNNALDNAPVWEDCTEKVRSGGNHVFANEIAANGFAFNFKVEVSRGASGIGGYISSVQGGFQ